MFAYDLKNVFNLFFPKRCFLCKSNISVKEFLCDDCYSFCHIFPNPTFLKKNNNTGALFYYELTIRELILKAKFNNDNFSLQILKNIITKNLREQKGIEGFSSYQPSIITYVPTHWRSRVFRGYDLPEVFAQLLSNLLQVPATNLLSLRKYKPRQSLMKAKTQRISTIRDAFILKHENKRFSRILLVDDIITTKATLYEAMRTLRPICSDMRGFAIAQTP